MSETSPSLLTPEDKISAIKRTALLYYPVLGTGLSFFKFVENKNPTAEGAKTIRAFRNGIMQWTRGHVDVTPGQELFKLFVHALLHIVLKEHERSKMFDPVKFRYLMENNINHFIELSTHGCTLGPKFFRNTSLDGDIVENSMELVPKGITREEVEDMCPVGLPLDFHKQECEEGEGEGGSGSGQVQRPQMDIPTAALAEMESAAKGIGLSFDQLRILIGDIYQSVIPWEERLKEFCREAFGAEGRTYRRLSRRSFGMGVMLPGKDKGLTTPCIAIDLSGSIVGDKDLVERFLSEACEILRICKKEARFLLHEVDVVDDFTTNDPAEVIKRLKGGGGTSFVPLYRLLDEEPPQCLVHCTDLYGEFPAIEPKYPVLFVTGKDHASADVPGFGSIIEAVSD